MIARELLELIESIKSEDKEAELDSYRISSGTIQSLTGLRSAMAIERFQVALANYAYKHKSSSWIEAFKDWMKENGVTVDRRGRVNQKEFKDTFGDIFGD